MAYIRLGSVVSSIYSFEKLVLSSFVFFKHLFRLPILILFISLFSTNFTFANNQEMAQGIVQILSQIGGEVEGAPQCGGFDREKMRKHKEDAKKERAEHLSSSPEASGYKQAKSAYDVALGDYQKKQGELNKFQAKSRYDKYVFLCMDRGDTQEACNSFYENNRKNNEQRYNGQSEAIKTHIDELKTERDSTRTTLQSAREERDGTREAYYNKKRELRYQYYCDSVVANATEEALNHLGEAISNVTEYAKYNVCSCCENPARCFFSTPGRVMNALTQVAPLGTAVGLGVGAKSGSDICKDVGNVQKLLGVMNGMAALNCAGKNSACMQRYHACVAKIDEIRKNMQEVEGIVTGRTSSSPTTTHTTPLPPPPTGWKQTLDQYGQQLEEDVRPRCKFAKKASGHMFIATGALFGEAMLSKVCSKGLEGGDGEGEEVASNTNCFDPNDEKYNSDECHCVRVPASNECLCSREENKDLAVCKKTGSDGSPEYPEGSNGPGNSSNPESPNGQWDGFSESDSGKTDASDIFGDPDVNLSSGNSKGGAPAGSPQVSRGSPSGGTGGLGGVGGFSGSGSSGEEGEEMAEGEGDDEGADYSNLMQGLTGKTPGGSGSYGGYNSNRPSDDDDSFDLSQFLPKGNKERGVAGANKGEAVSSRNESIFEVSSKVTRVYCQNNQVECISEQRK